MSRYAVAKRNRRLLESRWLELNTRRTEDGHEKLCGHCQEWLPLDDEFFGFMPERGHYRSYCRFCEAELTRERKMRQRAMAGLVLVPGDRKPAANQPC